MAGTNDCPHASVEGSVIICDQTGDACIYNHPNASCLLAQSMEQEMKRRKEKFR